MTEQTPDEMLAQAESQIQQALTGEMAEAIDEIEIEDAPEAQSDSDDVEVEIEEPVAEAPEAQAEAEDPEAAEIEKARNAGWRPKEEYNGPPGKWKDYKEFNAVGDKIASKLNAKIDSMAERNRKQEEMIKKLIKAQGAVAKQAHEEAMAKLKAERREAIEMGDADAVDEIDTKIAKAEEAKPDLEVDDTPPPVEIEDVTKDFVEAEKGWYNAQNPDMVKYAIAMEQVVRRMGETDTATVLNKVKQMVAIQFPDRMPEATSTPQKRRPTQAPVETGATPVRTKQTVKLSDFPEEVRRIADYFEKNGVMSKQDYLKQLKEGMA